MATDEVRTVDPDTGGEKGAKLARFDLIPVGPLWALAEVYGYGCKKYSDRNWEKGYKWSLSYAALQRHLSMFWDGHELDAESGLPHLAHAAWHCMALMEWGETHPEKDDRSSSLAPPEPAFPSTGNIISSQNMVACACSHSDR